MKSLFHLLFLGIICSTFVFSQTDSINIEDQSTPLSYEVVAYGGGALPYLPTYFKNNWRSAWSAGIGYGISFPPGELGYITLYQTIDYNKMKFQQSSSYDGNYLNSGAVHITNIMVNLKGNIYLRVLKMEPYFLLGVGAMNYVSSGVKINEQGITTVKNRHQLAFAWTFGLGIEVPVNQRIGVFVEGKSMLGVVEPTKQIFPLHAGVHLRF